MGGRVETPVVTFHRIGAAALPPLPADTSALGQMPTTAYRYCQAMRGASSFGWYVFPALDLELKWDGAEVRYRNGNEWVPLVAIPGDDDFLSAWREHAPDDLKVDGAPSFCTRLGVAGYIQIWSGYLISTAPGWSILIRPLVNLPAPRVYECTEGLIETDTFRPCPLFMNLKLLAVDQPILISRFTPLFQVQPVHRASYTEATAQSSELSDMSPADWEGYRRCTKPGDLVTLAESDHVPGRYGAEVRGRAKREERK